MYCVTLFSNTDMMGFITFTAAGHQGAVKIFGFTDKELSSPSLVPPQSFKTNWWDILGVLCVLLKIIVLKWHFEFLLK